MVRKDFCAGKMLKLGGGDYIFWFVLKIKSFILLLHIINGEFAMVIKNSRYIENGTAIPPTKGKIQEYILKKFRRLNIIPNKYASLYDWKGNEKGY